MGIVETMVLISKLAPYIGVVFGFLIRMFGEEGKRKRHAKKVKKKLRNATVGDRIVLRRP